MEKAFRLSSVAKCLSLQLPRCLVSPGRLGYKGGIRHGSKPGISTTVPPEEGKSLVQYLLYVWLNVALKGLCLGHCQAFV